MIFEPKSTVTANNEISIRLCRPIALIMHLMDFNDYDMPSLGYHQYDIYYISMVSLLNIS